MKLEVGKIYRCEGDSFVKIIHYEDREFFGVSCDNTGGMSKHFAKTYSFSESGRSSPRNPCRKGWPLAEHDLKELKY